MFTSNETDADGIVFTDEKTQEYEELIEAQMGDVTGKSTIITTDGGDWIDVDDI